MSDSRHARNMKRFYWWSSPFYLFVAVAWFAAYVEGGRALHLVLAIVWLALTMMQIVIGFTWRSTEHIRVEIEATRERIRNILGGAA